MIPIETCLIPFQNKFIIYRPLLHLAFLGNRAMGDLAMSISENSAVIPEKSNPEAVQFLRQIGFMQPDPVFPKKTGSDNSFKPVSAALLMTNRCNLRCIYCYANGGEEPGQDLSESIAKRTIDTVSQNAIDTGAPAFVVTFHGGGEPTLAWNTLISATEYARSKSIPAKIYMVSNGIWNDMQFKWIIKHIDEVTISMDGNQETQNLQRPFPNGEGSFPKVMQTIRALDKSAFPYNIRVTITPERFSSLPEDILFLCENTNCRSIQVEPAFNHVRGSHSESSAEQERTFSEAFLQAWDISHGLKKPLQYSGARPWILTDAFCEAPLGQSLTVNPLGEVVGCYEITGRKTALSEASIFGKCDETDFMIDEGKRHAFVRQIENRKKACTGCFCRWHCAGDCYTRGMPVNGGVWPYARCAINREITAGLILRSIAEQDAD